MDQSATFARHFSRLLWLLLNEGGSVDEQKMSLRATVQAIKLGPVSVVSANLELRANDTIVPAALAGVRDVAARMTAHSIRAVTITRGAKPPDLLGFARILAADAVPNDGGAQVSQKLAALGAGSLTLTTIEAVPGRSGADVPVGPVTVPAPFSGAPLPKARRDASSSAMSVDELLRALDAAGTSEAANTKALDDLIILADHSARIGKAIVVADIFTGVLSRHGKLADGDVKSAFAMSMRRLSKPALLRAVAGMIIKHPERKQPVYEILKRTGEDGSAALIEQVGQARTAGERQKLLAVLTTLPDAVPALIRMLGDSRWFVVRSAADLLGEMVAIKAEDALVQLLGHGDDRVRRSATNALLKLGTPNAVKGVYEAVRDSSPVVRMQVAAALSIRKDAKTTATLILAIDSENDGDVQLAMIAALGKIATPEAVQKLVKMALPAGRLFGKKDAGLRVAAVQALGEARTQAAAKALKELMSDKDKDVRETANRALAQAR